MGEFVSMHRRRVPMTVFSVLEFPSIMEAEDAMKRLAGIDINGSPVTVELSSVSHLRQSHSSK